MNSALQTINPVSFVGIGERHAGQRLDNFLMAQMNGVPKSRIYQMIRKGEVRINKKRAKVSSRLCLDDLVRIPPHQSKVAEFNDKPLNPKLEQTLKAAIVYEDDALLVINKPSGLAVHGGSGVSLGLIEALRRMYPKAKMLELVHRLDKETSGLVMVAKKRSMLIHCHECLRKGRISKQYLALVPGTWQGKSLIDAPLLKRETPNGDRRVSVHLEGKPSQTRVRVHTQFDTHTLLQLKPITGRTHQLRVHLAHCGQAIVGDDKYGSDPVNKGAKQGGLRRLFLHASDLTIPLPEQDEFLRLKADLPEECAAYCRTLRG